jgi:3-hydroxyacyl-[acyl-carrier-protein] dehydratase
MTKVNYGPDEIAEYLPHRPPFLFVDRVTELEPGNRILAELDLKPDDPHFTGHFPGNPIMPGVLITEALAQTAGLLLAFTAEGQGLEARGRLFFLARADMKWTVPAHPGDTLLLEATLLRSLDKLVAFRVRAFTRRDTIASGKVTLARVK